MKTKLVISGFGSYLPEKVITNQELERMMNVSEGWVESRTGVKERHVCDNHELTYHLAVKAARRAIEDSGVAPEEIDLVIFSTMLAEYGLPGMGMFFLRDLGLPNKVACIEIRNQCAGFLYGMEMSNMFLLSGKYRHTLVVCTERQYEYFAPYPSSSAIFGDGAAAAVFSAVPEESDNRGLLDLRIYSDGEGANYALTTADAYPIEYVQSANLPEWKQGLAEMTPDMIDMRRLYYWTGRKIFQVAVTRMIECTRDILKRTGLTLNDIDYFAFHQANKRINTNVAERLEIPPEKLLWNIEVYGNTTSATIPLLLDENYRNGKFKTGDLILMCTFGVGYVWGAGIYRF